MAQPPSVSDIQQQKKALRREIRQRRLALSGFQQRQAARSLFRLVCRSPLFRYSQRIAFTLARDGEINPGLLMQEALKRNKQCYLPVMNRFGESRLQFRRWQPGQRLVRGNYGIPEPRLGQSCRPQILNLVFMPLVALDSQGNRLGMGKGYYDHSFAFLQKKRSKRPSLVGLAHECQRVEGLEVAPWDVPLEAIVTDRQWYPGSQP